MKESKRKSAIGAGIAIPLIVLSLGIITAGGTVFGGGAVPPEDREAAGLCADCHEDYAESLAHTAHSPSLQSQGEAVTCADCHSGAAKHVDEPEENPIGNPAKLYSPEVTHLCSACHQPHTDLDNRGYNVHLDQDFSCLECHSVHNSSGETLRKPQLELCVSCHPTASLDSRRRSSHPLHDGEVTCLDCHSFIESSSALAGDGVEARCRSCHPEHGGPFLYEHIAVEGAFVEGEGCLACHDPHGSGNNFLLRQEPEQLCRSCHMEPALHQTQHGAIATRHTCNTCHSEIHGSFSNDHFLNPDLEILLGDVLECYNSGCHAINSWGGE